MPADIRPAIAPPATSTTTAAARRSRSPVSPAPARAVTSATSSLSPDGPGRASTRTSATPGWRPLALAIPAGYAGFVLPRSGLAMRHGVTCLNTPGLIDSGYRGELSVLLVNTDPDEDFEVRRGDRVAQLVVQPVEQAQFEAVAALEPSERGAGGFGHTGR